MDDTRTRTEAPAALQPGLAAALGLLEQGERDAARALLTELEEAARRLDEPAAHALALVLLAQLDCAADALDAAQARADASLAAAARTDDRELIHRCLSLQSSLRLLRDPRL